MGERYFWTALGLICISFIINTWYAQSKQLKEPIFLDHYIETTVGEHNLITFYYLVDKNDSSRISYVDLGGLTGYVQNDFFYTDSPHQNIDTFTYQALRSINVQLQSLDFGDKDLLFEEMDVFYTNGERHTVSIGEVIIHPERYVFSSDGTVKLEHKSGGGGTDGRGWDTYRATEPLTIEEISFPFNNPIEDQFTFSIKGNKTQTEKSLESLEFPIHLEKDQQLTLETYLSEVNFANYLAFFVRISGTTEQGESFTSYSGYNLDPYLSQDDVDRIIQEKTGRDSDE